MSDWFRRFAQRASFASGSPWTFIGALAIVVAWLVSGPFLAYSDHWQLIINTGTTVVTFLMVFLIQNAQNRDALAIHLKLDELIRSVHGARNALVNLENCTDEELEHLRAEFERVRALEMSRGAGVQPGEPTVRPSRKARPSAADT
jgi:low affinity Fe/Cu permease